MPPDGGRGGRAGRLLSATTVIALATAGLLTGCGEEATSETGEPYELSPLDGDLNLVTLVPEASERLLLETTPVIEELIDGAPMLAVPYGALIYDTTGGTWVYVQPEPLSYVRAAVSVDRIEGDLVYLTDGPELGTPVAITSVAELYGIDTGVGK